MLKTCVLQITIERAQKVHIYSNTSRKKGGENPFLFGEASSVRAQKKVFHIIQEEKRSTVRQAMREIELKISALLQHYILRL